MFYDPAFHGGPETLSVHVLDKDVRPESASLDLTCGGGRRIRVETPFLFPHKSPGDSTALYSFPRERQTLVLQSNMNLFCQLKIW